MPEQKSGRISQNWESRGNLKGLFVDFTKFINGQNLKRIRSIIPDKHFY